MLSDDVLAELREKHKRVCHIRCGSVDLVLRAPTRAEYRTCRAKSHSPSTAADAQEDLVRAIVVYPARTDFDALLDEYPGLCEHADVSKQIGIFTGLVSDDSRK